MTSETPTNRHLDSQASTPRWAPSEDGRYLLWNGGTNFYYPAEWLSYFRSYFIVHVAAAFIEPERLGFLKPHRMSGIIHAVGEEAERDVKRLKADDDGIFISQGQWTELARREVFKEDPDQKHKGLTDYVSRHVAIDYAHQPGFVAWDAWRRIPDFTLPHDEALVHAQKERAALNQAAPAAQSTPNSTRPTL